MCHGLGLLAGQVSTMCRGQSELGRGVGEQRQRAEGLGRSARGLFVISNEDLLLALS